MARRQGRRDIQTDPPAQSMARPSVGLVRSAWRTFRRTAGVLIVVAVILVLTICMGARTRKVADVPHYLIPPPTSMIAEACTTRRPWCFDAFVTTFVESAIGFTLAAVAGHPARHPHRPVGY